MNLRYMSELNVKNMYEFLFLREFCVICGIKACVFFS